MYEKKVQQQITRQLTQNQYDACVSFCYNLGSMLELAPLINAGIVKNTDWGRYVYARGKKLDGLVKRRAKEWQLYISK